MKHMIERYVYDVTRRLPENQREDVAKELRANIDDMLSGSTNEVEIEKVLLSLGEPRTLANEYREKKRYLISPKWMDDYIRVLKIVIIIFVSISVIFGLIDNIMNAESLNAFGIFAEVFAKTISEAFQSAFQAFAIVTLVFVLIEQYDLSPKKKEWSVSSLPDLPNEKEPKVSRTGSIVELIIMTIFGVTWIYLLFNHSIYLGWMVEGNGWAVSVPLFNSPAVNVLIPLFIASLALGIIAQMIKIYYARLNMKVMIFHTLDKIFSLAVVLFFMTMPNLINGVFALQASTFLEISTTVVWDMIKGIATGIISVVSIATLLDLIFTWIKSIRGTIKSNKN
ncbi:MAG: hypothetical protein KKE16_02850 [Firmicutes bacterium]|nr:hypothetical protein [Bacillota bacterium]